MNLARTIGRLDHQPCTSAAAAYFRAPEPAAVGANDNDRARSTCTEQRWASALPQDARAVIYQRGRSVNQSGRSGANDWLLEFEPRSRPFADFLTGWTGSDDPLAHLALRFPTREAAVRFAQRQGISYRVREPSSTVRWFRPRQAFQLEPALQARHWPPATRPSSARRAGHRG